MRHHKYTNTLYQFTFVNKEGETVYTLWFNTRNLTINRVMRLISQNSEKVFTATKSEAIYCDKINESVIVQAGECLGSLTGNTNYQVNGYA